MKKYFLFLLFGFSALVSALAQADVLPEVPVTLDLKVYVASFYMFAATTLAVTALLNRFAFKWTDSKARYLSWAVSLIIGYIAYFADFGIFIDATWYQVLIYVVGFALGANGLFKWEPIQAALKYLNLKVE